MQKYQQYLNSNANNFFLLDSMVKSFKIARPELSQNGHGQNNRFDSFVYTHKQYSRFFFNHTHIKLYKEIQNKNVQQLTENTE